MIAAVALAAMAGCGNVEPPIKDEAQADGGCWEPQACPPGAADLSNGVGNGLCSTMVNGHPCVTGHSMGLTCWMSASTLTYYFASSCGECETLSRCP